MTDAYSPKSNGYGTGPQSGASSYGKPDYGAFDPDEILTQVKNWFKEDAPHCQEFHTSAREEFRYRAGDQWPEDAKLELEEQQRAPITFNRIDPVIDAVVGAEITNRQEVRYVPRQIGDAPANEVLSEAARWFRDECDAEHEESSAFADAATCGMGWTETLLDYEENPDGAPEIKRIDPLQMFWDASCQEANLVNARRVYRVRTKVPLEEVKARWPEHEYDETCYDATWAAGDSEEEIPHENQIKRHEDDSFMEREGSVGETVTLVQVQWYERETYYRASIMDPMSGQSQEQEFNEEQDTRMKIRTAEMGLMYRSVRQVKKCYYEAFLGQKVLEVAKMVAPSGKPCNFFKFVPITGKLDRHTGQFYGLVRGMMGPQQFANKWLSTAVEIMARSAKGGLLLEEDAVADVEEFEEKWATPGKNAYVKSGAISGNKINPKPKTEFPSDFMQMTQFAISSIRDVTGVSVELLGMAAVDQAASLEYQRRQASTTILSPLFDSLRRYRRIQGRVLLHYITEYLSDGRLVRITGIENAQYVPLTKQSGVQEYDVIVDDAPSSPNQKEMVWNSLIQVMPLVQNLQPPPEAILALLDYSPIPASVVAKIKQAVAQAQSKPQPPDPLTIKAEEAKIKMMTDVEGKKIDIQHKQQDHTQEIMHKERMAALEYQIEVQKMGLKAREMEMKARFDQQTKAQDFEFDKIIRAEEHEMRRNEMDQKITANNAPTIAMVKPVADAMGRSLLAGLTELAKTHGRSSESFAAILDEIRKPRRRTLVRGKDGRASHAIDEIMER